MGASAGTHSSRSLQTFTSKDLHQETGCSNGQSWCGRSRRNGQSQPVAAANRTPVEAANRTPEAANRTPVAAANHTSALVCLNIVKVLGEQRA